ncbi:MAG: alginate lyase family protein [Verrucomicrobiota bacterium]|nr:alginate lyase family protein [Verrucomicrobiota bacterium]
MRGAAFMGGAGMVCMLIAGPAVCASDSTTLLTSLKPLSSESGLRATESKLIPSAAFVEHHRDQLGSLLSSLDLTRPDLSSVSRALADGDLRSACAALLLYYQTRPSVPIQAKYGGDIIVDAEAALLNTFSFQGVKGTQPTASTGGLDWEARGPRDDPEWAWMLNRHGYFSALALAWKQTGDDRFAAKVSTLIIDWTSANPYPKRLNFSPSWRALETARRVLDTWPLTWQTLQDAPGFTPEARLLMLCSLLDHADLLQHYSSFWGGNHLLTEKTAIAQLAIAWPEFRDSRAWLDYAIDKVEEEILEQTYEDGAYKELTDHYQRVVLVNLDSFLNLCRSSGRDDLGKLEARMRRMWAYYTGIMQPNGHGPLTNAADRENIAELATALQAPEEYLQVNRAANPALEQPQTTFFPYAGQAVLRSSWYSSAVWAFLDAGPYGTAHQHEDRLHLDLSFGQQEILVDAGRYTYQPGPWLDYFKGPHSHNLLLLDGNCAIRGPYSTKTPATITTRTGTGWTYALAEAAFPANPARGLGQSTWRRGLLLLPNESGLIVFDEVIGYGNRELEARWHFAPSLSIKRTANGLSASANGQAGMELLILSDAGWSPATLLKGQETPEVAGWYAPNYNIKHPATEAHFTAAPAGPSITAWWFHNPAKRSNINEYLSSYIRQGESLTLVLATTRNTCTVVLPSLEKGPSEVSVEIRGGK